MSEKTVVFVTETGDVFVDATVIGDAVAFGSVVDEDGAPAYLTPAEWGELAQYAIDATDLTGR